MMNKFKNGLGHSLVLAGMCLAMLLFMSHKSVAQEVGEVGYMYTPDAQTTFRYVITTAADGGGNGGEVAVRKYNDNVSGAIEIPSSVTINVGGDDITYSVTSVKADGFKNCASITGVTIPNSVTVINGNAFQNCTSLASATLGTGLTTIGSDAFNDSGLTSITLPNSMTSIGDYAFRNTYLLTSITIPSSVTTIGNYAFAGSGLNSITIPSSVTTIGSNAFENCLNSQGALDLSNVTSIGVAAFLSNGSNGITSVVFNSSLTTIPENAFRNRGLTSVNIPASVTSIGVGAFYGCVNMTDVTFNRTESAPAIDSVNTFSHLKAHTTTFHVPSGMLAAYKTAIGWNSYDRYHNELMSELYYIVEGDEVVVVTVDGIRYTVLDAVNRKAQVDYNRDVSGSKTIASSVSGFGSGDETSQSYEVTTIIAEAFNGSSLTSITLPNSMTSIGDYAFRNTYLLTSITIPSSVTTIGNYAFAGSGLNSITLPSSVTTIGNYAFAGSGLNSITIPSSVTTIGNYAFENCLNSQGALDLSNVTSLGEGAFQTANTGNGITSVVFNSSLTTIPANAFRGRGLTSVNIPASVTSIGAGAFYGCVNMTDVTFNRTESAPAIDSVNTFSHLKAHTTTFHVPSGMLAAYKTAIGWNSYDRYHNELMSELYYIVEGDEVVVVTVDGIRYTVLDAVNRKAQVAPYNSASGSKTIASSVSGFGSGDETSQSYEVTTIGVNAFRGGGSLASISIPSSVTTIGSGAFYNSNLPSITIPSSVTTIGNYAFENCLNSQGALDLSNVTSLGEGAFQTANSGNGITSVVFNSSLTTIPANAFRGRGLTTVTIPASVTSIGADAFYNTSSLTSVTFGGSGLTTIGAGAFYNSNLPSITLPSSVTTIGNYAFENCLNSQGALDLSNVTSLGEGAFQTANTGNGITSVVFNSSLTTIPANAFRGRGLTSVNIPASVTSIGDNAFKGNTVLVDITFQGTTPPTIPLVENNFIDNTPALQYIYVPCANLAAYKTAYTTEYIPSTRRDKIFPIRSGAAIASTLTSDLYLTGEDCDCKAIPSTLTISNNSSLSFEDYTNFAAAMEGVTIKVEKELDVDTWNLLGAINGTRAGETYEFLDNNIGLTTGLVHGMAAVPYDFENNAWGDYATSISSATPIAAQSIFVYPVKKEIDDEDGDDLADTKVKLTQTIFGNNINERNNIHIPLTTTNSQKWYPLANPYLGRLNLNKFHEANEANLQDNYVWTWQDGEWESVDVTEATNYAVYPTTGFMVYTGTITEETEFAMHVNHIVKDETVTMKQASANKVSFLATSTAGVEKEMFAHIDEVSDNGYGKFDANVMFSTNEDAVNPYFVVENRNIFDNYFSQLPATFDVNFNAYKSNAIDFALTSSVEEIEVTLIDIANGNAETVLNVNEPVSISVAEGDNALRYKIRFARKNSAINDVASEVDNISIWNSQSVVTINGKNLKKVEIYNTLGQRVYSSSLYGESTTFDSKLNNGAYIIKVYTTNSSKSEKVIIR